MIALKQNEITLASPFEMFSETLLINFSLRHTCMKKGLVVTGM